MMFTERLQKLMLSQGGLRTAERVRSSAGATSEALIQSRTAAQRPEGLIQSRAAAQRPDAQTLPVRKRMAVDESDEAPWSGAQRLAGAERLGESSPVRKRERVETGGGGATQREEVPLRIDTSLNRLTEEARLERLEWAVPLIEAMQTILAVEQAAYQTPPGTLTVKGWIGLLNRWESQLGQTRKRQIFFAKPFFQDAWERSENDQSPLAPVLHELVVLMDRSLEIRD